ncbi:MAG: sigma-70 family RNA polymerase sigma factor [Gemmatimonadota bacterium]|jgi:RNA polymerase sigma-70 factor (ECF subfamily)|nr:sigma-70 family RNA polymerase sigma factor [Gemmatimonadota bacterium]
MADPPERTPANRTPPLPDEAAVIDRAARGDRTAFAQLMEHYQSASYGLAFRLLGDPDQAADATQDAFVHAYRAIGSFRGGVFRSWLLRITANASYDIMRRAQRRPSSPLPDGEEGSAPELPDIGAVNPVVEATKSELYRHLERALRRLPEDQRIAVVLCDVYGMDYNEVAAMTQSALGTVKSRIHRGRLRLRELLAEHRELFTG